MPKNPFRCRTEILVVPVLVLRASLAQTSCLKRSDLQLLALECLPLESQNQRGEGGVAFARFVSSHLQESEAHRRASWSR